MTSIFDKELELIKSSIKDIERRQGEKKVNNPHVRQLIEIVEDFLRKKKLICYGGTAINNVLPQKDQFYDKDVEIPDYDFFSKNALKDAKELADIYAKNGYENVVASSGAHGGTFKVFVEYIPVADITLLDDDIYNKIHKECVVKEGIYYCSPNYLRMSMYLELSRPDGDVSRWEKVYTRLVLLNKNYPVLPKGKTCKNVEIQRFFTTKSSIFNNKTLFLMIREILIDENVVFFGAMANSLYNSLLKKKKQRIVKIPNIPDFDVLSKNPEHTAELVKSELEKMRVRNVSIRKYKTHSSKKDYIEDEVISPHYEVLIGDETVLFIYKPLACHAYNEIMVNGRSVKIASIDTMLSFYLAFLFTNKDYYDSRRLMCMCEILLKIQFEHLKKNIQFKSIFKRFDIPCYGYQKTLEDIKKEKNHLFEKFKKGTEAYEYFFMKYTPTTINKSKKTKKKSKSKRKKTRKSTFF
jgi:hypothetical protein